MPWSTSERRSRVALGLVLVNVILVAGLLTFTVIQLTHANSKLAEQAKAQSQATIRVAKANNKLLHQLEKDDDRNRRRQLCLVAILADFARQAGLTVKNTPTIPPSACNAFVKQKPAAKKQSVQPSPGPTPTPKPSPKPSPRPSPRLTSSPRPTCLPPPCKNHPLHCCPPPL